ncbi:MAG: hypothetical protein QOD26_336 [Betaproteobacteria bacterium]|jgi:hypothetical protein|nr:hypothetical protein [Betaproteobacteria bacterium]
MKLINTMAALAVCAVLPLEAQAVSTPPPTSGSLDVWFKAPRTGNTVSGTLSGATCYVAGAGVSRVQFFMDGTALNTDSTMSDGMQCQLDTTKFANGAHQLKAVAYTSSGASRADVISVNVQNQGSPPPGGDPTPPPTGSLPAGGKGIATFESVGLYWTPPSNPGSAGCDVSYRKAGESAYKSGMSLWYDSRNNECRGSLVHLTPGTDYEVRFALAGKTPVAQTTVKTWSEQFPIARTVQVTGGSGQLNITEGGSPSGYVLYTGAAGTVRDAANGADFNIKISAPYVIVRGLTLKGARMDAIQLAQGAHDVVIENNDISGWGRSRGGSLGLDMEAAVKARCTSSFNLERVVVQNNRMHDPRYGSNSWSTAHPEGPQAISFIECGGNHVFRYNEIWSSSGHYFNDGIGGGENFSTKGFPNSDTDIYGNRIANTYDDGIESEGANKNVRIWGNYIDDTYIAVASTVTHTGPFYVFRNVYNRGGTFGKSGQKAGYGGGRRYFLHNTLLQPSGGAGANEGIKGNTGEPMTNTVSRNNNWNVSSSGGMAIGVIGGSENSFDYDLSNGSMTPYSGAEQRGFVGMPVYASGNGATSGAGGMYQLAPTSRGYDTAVRLPNFNDSFLGAGPDVGAHEAGAPAMRFGVR